MQLWLSIRVVAERYHISARTLRFYEEAGILHSRRKDHSRYREYDSEQIKRLEIILLLRRLRFSVREIACLLNEEGQFKDILEQKIRKSDIELIEARETNQLLRRLAELAKPSSINTADILNEFIYITKQTERMIPLNPIENQQYKIAIGRDIVARLIDGSDGNLIGKIKDLRSEFETAGKALPATIRVYDTDMKEGVTPTQAMIIWNGEEVWKEDFVGQTAALCSDVMIAKIRELAGD